MLYAGILLGCVLIAVIIYKPFFGLCLVIIANQLEYFFPIGSNMSVGRFLGLAVVLGWLVQMSMKRKSQFMLHKNINILMIVYLLSVSISVFTADIRYFFPYFFKLTVLLTLTWLVQDLVDRPAD